MAKREGIQLAYPFSEERLLNKGRYKTSWSLPAIIQPKLDGERCRAIVSDKRCLLLSSTGEIIPSTPHINSACTQFLPNGEYDGELYNHGWQWNKIHGVVSTVTTLHPNHEQIQLHLFDLIDENSQLIRLGDLLTLKPHIPNSAPIKFVTTEVVNTFSEIMDKYQEYISNGYEGFILRHLDALYLRRRTPAMMKFKPKKTDEYPITYIHEASSESGELLNMLGSFECVDDMGTRFKVGAGHLTHQERKEIWQKWLANEVIKGTKLQIEYQTLSTVKKVPHFSRAIRLL